MAAKKGLPPISELFKKSWETFKKSVLNLFFLALSGIGIFIGIFIVVCLISLPFGFASIVSAISSQKLTPAFFSSLGGIGLVAVIGIIAFVLIDYALQASGIIFVGKYKTKPAFSETFKKGFSYVWPLFLLGILSGLMVGGAYFLFVIPGIVLGILFTFAPYEIILNKQGVLSSLKRSAKIVLNNFWEIIARLIVWLVIALAVYMLPNFFFTARNTAGTYPFISAVINVLLGWFGLCYSVTLYKQAAEGMEKEKGIKLFWPVLLGIVGWVVGIIVTISVISLITALIIQNVEKGKIQQKTNGIYQVQKYNRVTPGSSSGMAR